MKTGVNRLKRFGHAGRKNNGAIVKTNRKSRNKGYGEGSDTSR